METEMFCLSLSVECRSFKALWMYVSHVYLSFCKLTSQSIWILFLLLALWIQIKEENVCVCVCVCVFCVCVYFSTSLTLQAVPQSRSAHNNSSYGPYNDPPAFYPAHPQELLIPVSTKGNVLKMF